MKTYYEMLNWLENNKEEQSIDIFNEDLEIFGMSISPKNKYNFGYLVTLLDIYFDSQSELEKYIKSIYEGLN